MKIRVIKNDADHEAALARIDELFDAPEETPEFEELEVWMTLVKAYEDEAHPIPAPSPLEAIRFVMDQRGLRQKDLTPYIGAESKVSEVLSGKRPLSLTMIRKLHEGLGIPLDTLLQTVNEQLVHNYRQVL